MGCSACGQRYSRNSALHRTKDANGRPSGKLVKRAIRGLRHGRRNEVKKVVPTPPSPVAPIEQPGGPPENPDADVQRG